MTFLVSALGAAGVMLVYDGIAGGRRPPSRRAVRRLDALAAGSGIRGLTGRRLLALGAGAFVLGAIAGAALTASAVVALVAGAAAGRVPFAVAGGRRDRRRRRFREAWPDAIATIVASVRAGVSLPEACAALTQRGPLELRDGFDALTSTYRATGSFDAGLARLRATLADPIADRVAVALQITHDVGGTDLVRVLRTLADFVRDDLRTRKEVEARWSWTVTAARVAAAAPWIVLGMMALRPEAAAVYDSAAGVTVILCGAVATFAGYRLMLRAARLPEEERLGG